MTSHNPATVSVYPSNWKFFRLGELGAFTKGAGITKHDLIEDGIPCIRYGEIYTSHDFIIKDFYSFISHEVAESSKQIFAGDILFAGSGETAEEIGKCVAYVGHEKAYAGGDIIILRLNRGDPEYLGYLLNHEIAKRQIYRMGQGHSVVHIYASNLQDVVVPLPPVPEQRKIGEIISTWDEAITHIGRQIVALQQRKKGLMQILLTGQVRFAEFDGAWKEVKLSDVFDERVERGFAHLPLLSVTENGITYRDDLERRDNSSEDKSKYLRICPGDIGYNTMRMWQGRSALSPYEGIVSPAYTILTPKRNIDPRFMAYLFKNQALIHTFYRYSQGLVSDTWNLK